MTSAASVPVFTSLHRGRARKLWEALCAYWLPVRAGFRTNAGRRCHQKAAQDRTCSSSPSRSSNVLMISPRRPNSLSPSPLRRTPTDRVATHFGLYLVYSGFVFIFVVYACLHLFKVFFFFFWSIWYRWDCLPSLSFTTNAVPVIAQLNFRWINVL